jgi:hypothetical protein
LRSDIHTIITDKVQAHNNRESVGELAKSMGEEIKKTVEHIGTILHLQTYQKDELQENLENYAASLFEAKAYQNSHGEAVKIGFYKRMHQNH